MTDYHAITDDGDDLVMRVVDGTLEIVPPGHDNPKADPPDEKLVGSAGFEPAAPAV